MKKKQKQMLTAIALAGSASYFLRTFPGGDTVIGAMIGAAFGHPLAGAVTGLLVPSRREGGIAILADVNPLGGLMGAFTPAAAPSGTETA